VTATTAHSRVGAVVNDWCLFAALAWFRLRAVRTPRG
jgi:hypothetical protein